jgi:hypothetical protein
MTISKAFDPPSDAPAFSPAQRVQCAIFRRLRPRYRDRAGDLGWLLVRLGQPEHREHEAAVEGVLTRSLAELTYLLEVIRTTRSMAKTADARAFCDAIITIFGDIVPIVSAREAGK